MFDKATRLKLRFTTSRGDVSVEDLWDLPLTSDTGRPNLDDVARDLWVKTNAANANISFVTPEHKPEDNNELALDIVKHIIAVRVAERDERLQAKAKSDKKQQILAILADKEVDALKGKSTEELQALIASM